MTLSYITMAWSIRQGIRFAWVMARAAEQLGGTGVRLEARLDAVAVARGVDMLDVLAPLNAPLSRA